MKQLMVPCEYCELTNTLYVNTNSILGKNLNDLNIAKALPPNNDKFIVARYCDGEMTLFRNGWPYTKNFVVTMLPEQNSIEIEVTLMSGRSEKIKTNFENVSFKGINNAP